MSNPRFPAELLDHTVDHLHSERDALKNCCLVSKSWIPRTRKHLFADTEFQTPADLQSWKTTFLDPSTSPARYTKSLFVRCPPVARSSGAGEGDWIRTFSRVVHLEIEVGGGGDYECLFQFHGFSPVVKSFRLFSSPALPPLRLFNLICSFPLLEDLSLNTLKNFLTTEGDGLNGQLAAIQPSSIPIFTGSLGLYLTCGMGPIASRLLLLPNGLRFRKLDLTWEHEDDIAFTGELVGTCCSTLEYLSITDHLIEPLSGSINLSKSTMLKDAMLECTIDPGWITLTLNTLTRDHRNLQLVAVDASTVLRTIHSAIDDVDAHSVNLGDIIGQDRFRKWLELDLLLAQLRESHSISLEIPYVVDYAMDDDDAKVLLKRLLPEVVGKGRAELIRSELDMW